MIEVLLAPMDRVRIWTDDVPVFGTVIRDPLQGESRRAAVEWYSPRGGYFIYGFLGARYAECGTPLSVRVEVADDGDLPVAFEVPVAGIDRLRAGLPSEYAHAVRRGAEKVAETRLDSGVLVFDLAVHGEVGSSAFVFERLAGCVTELLCISSLVAREEELVAALDRILRQPRE